MNSSSLSFRTWVDIDCAALRHNIDVVKSLAPHAGIIAVIKANAYGHGICGVASAISDMVSYFAVTSLNEAITLQQTVSTVPIMLLSAALPFEYPAIAEHGFIPTLSSFEEAAAFAKVAPQRAPVHVKIDTGMGRLGISYYDAEKTVAQIAHLPLTIQSISTHLSSADSNVRTTHAQLASFKKLIPLLRRYAPEARMHVLNSAGLLRSSGEAHELIRVGLMLYGISPIAAAVECEGRFLLQPVMTWKAQVSLIKSVPKGSCMSYGGTYKAPRNLRLAILSLGYADGYPRQLSNQGAYVLINGCRCSLLGRVTMDQLIVDISRAGNVSIGSEAVLLGKQGDAEITASWLAAKAGTISWHLFTGISERVQRCYLN